VRTTLYNQVLTVQSITQANRTNGTVNGTSTDLLMNAVGRQTFRSALVIVQTGTITDGTHTVEVQESDDNSSFTAVADADLQGTEPAVVAANDNVVFEIGYRGSKRYLRVVCVASGTTTGGTLGAVIVLGLPRRYPVAHS
jgi:hypothetical protein